MAALLPVVGQDALNPAQGPPRVVDLGERFEVSAAGQATQYVDPTRNCLERARVAAVFIALALRPPMLQRSEPPPAPPTLAPPPPPAESTREDTTVEDSSPRWARFDVSARVDSGSSERFSPADAVLGGEARGAVGRAALGMVAGVGAGTPLHRTFGTLLVRQQRFPFSLGVMARRKLSAGLELAADLGATLVLLRVHGEWAGAAAPATRLEAGVRLSVALRFPALAPGVFPFLGGQAQVFPVPYAFDVVPVGEIGQTDRVWLGISAGVSFGSP